MSLLVESIWIKNKRVQNIDAHQSRYEATLRMLFPYAKPVLLRKHIDTSSLKFNDVKCRIIYNETIQKIEYQNYIRKPIALLKIVHDNNINYDFKYVERQQLDNLYALRENCDEIIIVKNNLITDAYYYNIVLEKKGKYFTPKSPLLPGTCRAKLLNQKIIKAIDITIEDLEKYENIHLINALNPLGCVVLNGNSVRFV